MKQEIVKDLERLFETTQVKSTLVDVDRLLDTAKSETIAKCNETETLSRIDVSAVDSTQERLSRRAWTFMLVGAAGVLIAFFLPTISLSTSSIIFAQVQNRVQSVQSMSFVQVSYLVPLEARLGEAEEAHAKEELSSTVSFAQARGSTASRPTARDSLAILVSRLRKAGDLERTDLETQVRLLGSLVDSPNANRIETVQWIRIKEKHLQRTDHIHPYQRSHHVIDAKANLHVAFDHDRKQKQILSSQVVFDRDTGEKTEHQMQFSPKVDFFLQFQMLPANAKKLSEKRTIEGHDAIGFQTREEHEGTWLRTYWINPETYLPIEIVTEFKSNKPQLSSTMWVQSQFTFDQEMDANLFSTDTPEGYAAKESKVYGYK
ncbi:MAG: hypothetical protein R3C53_12555 [Pirellulaceae bacterium]